MKPRSSQLLLAFLGMPALLWPQNAAQESSTSGTQAKELAGMELESLLNLKVTTASKYSEKLSEAPGVISVVTRDELDRFGGMTLGEILDRVPGLTATTAYFTDRNLIAARGDQTKINGGHILFLINGRPTREILEGGLIGDLLESFPVNILDRIEVIRGPGSVLYGSNAFSAVVNLITQKADHDGFTVRGMGGAPGGVATSAEAMWQSGELNLVAAGQFHQDPEWTTTYRYREPYTHVLSTDIPTILQGGPGAYLGLNYRGLSLMSSFTGWDSESFVRGTAGRPKWRREFADLGYSTKAGGRWEMNLDLTFTRNTFALAEYPYIHRDSNELLLEWSNVVRVSSRDQLIFGALTDHIQGQENYHGVTPAVAISEGARFAGAGYAQLDHRLLETLKLIGGFQVNKIENIDLDYVPRVGVVWNPYSRFNVKALYSSAFRAPSLNETMLNHPGLEGNPNLKPEKVATIDLGISYEGKRVEAGVSYFRSHQTDSIVEDTSTPRWKYMNLGEAIFQGFELEGKYYFAKNFLLLGSVSYQRNVDGKGTENITPVPNLGVKAGVSYVSPKKWTAGVFDVYAGRLDPRYSGVLNPPPGDYHLLEAHARFDLSRYLGGNRAGLALIAHGENLANKQVWLPDWGDNSGDTIPVNRGRTVYIGIEVSFRRD